MKTRSRVGDDPLDDRFDLVMVESRIAESDYHVPVDHEIEGDVVSIEQTPERSAVVIEDRKGEVEFAGPVGSYAVDHDTDDPESLIIVFLVEILKE